MNEQTHSIVYVWHCPRSNCDAKGQTSLKPITDRILCMSCMSAFLHIESMVPLFLFQD